MRLKCRNGLPQDTRKFDLEDRTLRFAANVRHFLKQLPRSICNEVDGRQLLRSSGSVGANYIEANDNVGERDFLYRIKICRKEAKESRYWLRLFVVDETKTQELSALTKEAEELMRIFAAIYRTCAARKKAEPSPSQPA